ncbi:MAG: Flp pilus assembly protein CpaB [Deltaproteobacteria bacterium]|nr:Flp pilus assembly protein CpaB [Deltaproteobacteria bacterium]
MTQTRIGIVVVVAVLLALFASIGTYRFLSEKGRMAEEARLQTVGVVVAAANIPFGSTIRPDQVVLSAWPKDRQPKDVLSDVKTAVGRLARRDFIRGEPIVESKLLSTTKNVGMLSLRIPQGMRAFTVRVNEAVGVGGFLVPDARVDVLMTTASSDQRGTRISKIILEDIRVLAVGQKIDQKDSKPVSVETVTLAVTPENAEKLALASNDGKIHLVLRNFADSEKVKTTGISKDRLLSAQRGVPGSSGTVKRQRSRVKKAAPASPVRVKKYTVEVIKGNSRSEETF